MKNLQKPFHLYVIGSGAIGSTLAVLLKRAEKQVTLIRGSVDELATSVETFTVTLPDGSALTESIVVKTLNGIGHIDGIVIIAAKSNANNALAAKLALKGIHYPVVLLQNGLNIEEPFTRLGFNQLYRCVLFVTSQFTAKNVIRFKPVAACPVGMISGDGDQLGWAVSQLTTTWFPFRSETSILPVIWKKVAVNCVFNSVCPLLNADNGIFYRNSAALAIAKRMIRECIKVAGLCGVVLNEEEVTETLLNISRSSDGQLISTLQDINNNRPTEIGTLNLEVARIAAKMGKEHLVTETRLLGELTAIKSAMGLAGN